jgi:hypothetical protein
MKAVAASLVLLAGAVLFAGGAVAEATLTAARMSGYSGGGNIGMIVGALVGVAGLVLLALAWKSDSGPRS